jgi:hypothetical protein
VITCIVSYESLDPDLKSKYYIQQTTTQEINQDADRRGLL